MLFAMAVVLSPKENSRACTARRMPRSSLANAPAAAARRIAARWMLQMRRNPSGAARARAGRFPASTRSGWPYAFALGKPFTEAEVPTDLAEKRDKAVARAEKKAAAADEPPKPAKPKQVNKSALKKKIETQLAGLEVLETLVAERQQAGAAS